MEAEERKETSKFAERRNAAWEAYRKMCVSSREGYEYIHEPAWEAYEEIKRPAWEAHMKRCESSWEDYTATVKIIDREEEEARQ